MCHGPDTLAAMANSFDIHQAPGHLIRRAHQRAVALFMEETLGCDVTPVQFAILNALLQESGKDQITVAGRVALDAATSGSVIARLEARGWVRRENDPQDRRCKLLWITPQGEQMAHQLLAAAQRTQERLVEPLDAAERAQLLQLLTKLTLAKPA